MKKVVAILLTVAVLAGLLGVGVFAAEADPDREQTLAMLADVQKTLKSGSFTLKGRGPIPHNEKRKASMVLVADKDRIAAETRTDWYAMLKEKDPDNVFGNVCIAFFLTLLLGTKTRMVITGEQAKIVLPFRLIYVDITSSVNEEFGSIDSFIADAFLSGGTDPLDPDRIVTSWETIGGKRYQAAAIYTEEGDLICTYYFRNNKLKLLKMPEEHNSITVNTFKSKAETRYFSTAWMLRIPIERFLGAQTGAGEFLVG